MGNTEVFLSKPLAHAGTCVVYVQGGKRFTGRHPNTPQIIQLQQKKPNESWQNPTTSCSTLSSVSMVPSGEIGVDSEKERDDMGESFPYINDMKYIIYL